MLRFARLGDLKDLNLEHQIGLPRDLEPRMTLLAVGMLPRNGQPCTLAKLHGCHTVVPPARSFRGLTRQRNGRRDVPFDNSTNSGLVGERLWPTLCREQEAIWLMRAPDLCHVCFQVKIGRHRNGGSFTNNARARSRLEDLLRKEIESVTA